MRSRLWWIWAAAALALSVAYFAVGGAGARLGFYVPVAAGSAVALVVGVRVHRPQRPGAWLCIAAGLGTFALGDTVYYSSEALRGEVPPFPSWSDLCYLSCYAFLLLGLVSLARGASRPDRASLIDAAIVGIGIGLPLWVFFIAPYAGDTSSTALARTIAAGYPVADVVLLAAAAHLWFLPVRHPSSVRLLVLAVAPLVAADVVYGAQSLRGTWQSGTWVDAGWLLFYVLTAVAALHPASAEPVQERSDGRARLSGARVTGLVLASLVAPTMLVAQDLLGQEVASGPVAVAFVLVTVLVLLRVSHLVESLASAEAEQRSAAHFQSLVQSGSDVIVLVEHGGAVRYASPSSERVLGLAPERLTGELLLDLVHPSDAPRLAERLARAFDGQDAPAVEVRLRTSAGSWQWVESLASLPSVDEDGVACVVVTSRDVSERRGLEEQLTSQALHDPLTGLANRRRALREGMADARVEQPPEVAVLFLDLDDFKVVNDSLGHSAGDQLLVVLAARLQSAVRAGDTVARLGGDEFAVLLQDDVTPATAEATAERLVEALQQPVVIGSTELRTRASIGIAPAQAGDSGEDVLRNADLAMYMAKGAGKGRCAVYRPEMHTATLGRLELLADLRTAIDSDQLRLHYQPTVQLSSGAVTGVEALVRWQHPERGLISPGDFIPLAEESGLVVPLGRWVLRQACRVAAAWPQHPQRAPVTVAVNISTRHLSDRSIVQDVQDALAASGLAPGRLVVEITETGLVDDDDVVLEVLHALKRVGVRLAVDDFGTGYSSLSYLRRFPIDVLKVDKSFVDGLGLTGTGEASGLVQAILGMARTLQLSTVAEGIEQADQLAELADLGCDSGQGYLLSRPVPADQLGALLSATLLDAGSGLVAAAPAAR
jgi:diguanylate cyclase (GGDEF)-like protein/PAS domain S-box-containing protein